MTFSIAIEKCDTQHNDNYQNDQHYANCHFCPNVMFLYCYAEYYYARCHNAENCYAECRGTLEGTLVWCISVIKHFNC